MAQRSGWDSSKTCEKNHPDFLTSLKSTKTLWVALGGRPPVRVICFESQLFDGCSLGHWVEWAQLSNLNHQRLNGLGFFALKKFILMNQWQHTHTLIQCVYRPKKDVFKACINWKWKCMWLIMTGYHYQLLHKFSTVKDGKINWAMCVVLIRSSTCSKAVPGKRLVSAFYLSW